MERVECRSARSILGEFDSRMSEVSSLRLGTHCPKERRLFEFMAHKLACFGFYSTKSRGRPTGEYKAHHSTTVQTPKHSFFYLPLEALCLSFLRFLFLALFNKERLTGIYDTNKFTSLWNLTLNATSGKWCSVNAFYWNVSYHARRGLYHLFYGLTYYSRILFLFLIYPN